VLLECSQSPSVATCHSKEPTPLQLFVVAFYAFAEIGVITTISGRLEVNLPLSEKRGGKSHLGTILLI
jgi:hypothetical protein